MLLGSAFGKIEIDATGVNRGVQSAQNSLRGFQSMALSVAGGMQNLGNAMTVGFTLPLALAGKKAFDVFREFEQSLNVLKTVSGATEDEMKQLSDQARELGADLTLPGTSAADAANAMAELAKAGLDVNEILAASRGVLQLSVAGQIDNAEAAKITANALNAFGLSGEEAVRVADLLAAAALASTAEVSEMADSLQMSATVAAMTGIEIEDLVTALAMMSNAGISGSDAGTSVKQMLLSLTTPSVKAKGLMQDMGIAIYDASGNMKNMRDLIAEFSGKMGGLTQEQRNYALGVIFGSDAIRASNILLLGGVDAYDQMAEKVNETGAAAGLAASMMEGLTGSLENIKSAFETAAISAIEPFKDDLKAMLDVVAKVLSVFAGLPEPIRKIIVVGLLLLAVTGPLLILFGTLLGFIVNLTLAMQALGITLPMISTLLTGTLIPAIGAVLTALAPILLILGVLILYVGILYLMWKTNFLGMRDTALSFVNIVKNLWKALLAFLRGDTDAAMEYLQAAFDAFGEHINRVFLKIFGIKDAWAKFFDFMRNMLGNLVSYIVNTFSNVDWSLIGKFIMFGIANGMLFGIPGLILAATKAVKAVLETFDKGLENGSPSKKMMQRGVWSGQGYLIGLQNSMDPNTIARTLAKPITNNSSSQQQTIIQNFEGGVTMRQVRGMIDERIDALANTLINNFGGA